MLWETLFAHWPQVVAFLIAVFWFARLEQTVYYNTKEIQRLERNQDKENRERNERRKEDMETINATLHEMRADIKQLLTRQGYGNGTVGRDER